MSEFKIGEVAEVVGNGSGSGTTHHFDVGTVVAIRFARDSDGDYYVENLAAPVGQYVNEHDLERFPFQSGDRVRITSTGGGVFTVGTIGKVGYPPRREDASEYMVRVNGTIGFVEESSLEHVEEPEPEPKSGRRYIIEGKDYTSLGLPLGTEVTPIVTEMSRPKVTLVTTRHDEAHCMSYKDWEVGVTVWVNSDHLSEVPEYEEDDSIRPSHYKFTGGVEVIDITEHLSSNGGQAVQYIARSTRLDGNNKGNVLEDLRKSLWFINREIARIEEGG